MTAHGLRALGPHTADIQAHPKATTFPPEERQRTHVNGPIRFPQHLLSAHDHGRLRSS